METRDYCLDGVRITAGSLTVSGKCYKCGQVFTLCFSAADQSYDFECSECGQRMSAMLGIDAYWQGPRDDDEIVLYPKSRLLLGST